MRRMSISSVMSFGAGALAASYMNSRKSMRKMKRKVKSLF